MIPQNQIERRINGALADYWRTIELDPGSALAFANRAVIETLQGRGEQADQDFDKAFKIAPSLQAQFKEFQFKEFIENRQRQYPKP